MRFVDKIVLYKTPLDSKYTNVYDDYSTTDEYINFLANFPKITIPVQDELSTPLLKSRKDVNGTFTLVISGYTSMDLHDYNYILFYLDGLYELAGINPKFAFITAVDSVNDGDNSKSCFITCKLDTWSNHYLQIRQNSSANVFPALRYTYNEKYDMRYEPKTFPKFYKTISATYMSNKFANRGAGFVYNGKNDVRLLWLTTKISSRIGYDISLGSSVNFNSLSTINKNIVQTPFMLLNGNTPMTRYRIEFGVYDPLTQSIPNPRYVLCPDDWNAIVHPEGQYVLDCYATFFPQFDYHIIYTGKVTVDGVVLDNFRVYPYSGSIRLYEFETTGTTDSSLQIKITAFANNATTYANRTGRLEQQLYLPIEGSMPEDGKAFTPVADYTNTRLCLRFPYHRSVVIYNGNEIEFAPDNSDVIAKVIVNLYSQLSPSLSVDINGSEFQIKNHVNRSGSFEISQSVLANYLAQNSNRINQTIWQSILGGVANAGTGVASAFAGNPLGLVGASKSLTNSAFDIATIENTKRDLANYPALISSVCEHAGDDLIVQDDIVILEQNCIEYYKDSIRDMVHNAHNIGSQVSQYVSITAVFHELFDSASYENLHIVGIENMEDRDELESALKRGMTRWHISLTYNTDSLGNTKLPLLMSMNKNVYNTGKD